MNEKSLCPNTEFVCPKEGETDRDNGDWVGPNSRVDTRFGGTNPNVNEMDELGAPKEMESYYLEIKGLNPFQIWVGNMFQKGWKSAMKLNQRQ